MHHYSQLYYIPDGSETWTETNTSLPASSSTTPTTQLRPSTIVGVPGKWHLDDWPPFQLDLKQPSTHNYVDPHVIEPMLKEQFDYFYRECETFVLPMSIHPQVSGKPQAILKHERLFNYINRHEGAEWYTTEQMVEEFGGGSRALRLAEEPTRRYIDNELYVPSFTLSYPQSG
jgi:hypothetical protein